MNAKSTFLALALLASYASGDAFSQDRRVNRPARPAPAGRRFADAATPGRLTPDAPLGTLTPGQASSIFQGSVFNRRGPDPATTNIGTGVARSVNPQQQQRQQQLQRLLVPRN